MSITQNEKISQVKNTTLVVGIDISSETHYARAFDWRGLELSKIFKLEILDALTLRNKSRSLQDLQ